MQHIETHFSAKLGQVFTDEDKELLVTHGYKESEEPEDKRYTQWEYVGHFIYVENGKVSGTEYFCDPYMLGM